MRKLSRAILRAAFAGAACIPIPGLAHPGHGDTVHSVLGAEHAGPAAHELFASPWFAAVLLASSALALAMAVRLARARVHATCAESP